jgi:hypothetical protein
VEGNLRGWEPEKGILSQVREGMKVVDIENKEVGTVEEVFFGDAGSSGMDEGLGPATDSQENIEPRERMLDDFSFGGAGYSEDPRESELIESRMRRTGYIRIDSSGLFSSTRAALADQIKSIDGDRVRLNITRDELVEI